MTPYRTPEDYQDAVHLDMLGDEEDRLFATFYDPPKGGFCDHCGEKASLLGGRIETPGGPKTACSKECAQWLLP